MPRALQPGPEDALAGGIKVVAVDEGEHGGRDEGYLCANSSNTATCANDHQEVAVGVPRF